MKYDKIRKIPKQLLSLTGVSLLKFEALLLTFKYHWDEYHSHFTLKGEPRVRISYGRKSSQRRCLTDKLLFILSYMKNNPLKDYHATLFDMTQPQSNEWIHRLSDILYNTLKTLGDLPDRDHLRVKYLVEQCTDIFLDGTERPIERPKDSDRQKSCYSGKKTHNMKNYLVYTPDKRIL